MGTILVTRVKTRHTAIPIHYSLSPPNLQAVSTGRMRGLINRVLATHTQTENKFVYVISIIYYK